MFKKSQWLQSTFFKKIFKHGKTIRGDFFRIHFMLGSNFKCSVVISKKVLKRRVDRNRQKRRILHILKELLSSEEKNIFVVHVQKDPSSLNTHQLREHLSLLISPKSS